jgi:hypothetical protein
MERREIPETVTYFGNSFPDILQDICSIDIQCLEYTTWKVLHIVEMILPTPHLSQEGNLSLGQESFIPLLGVGLLSSKKHQRCVSY